MRRETSVSGSSTSLVGLLTDLYDHRAFNSLERSRRGEELSATTDGFPELELPLLAAKALRNVVRRYFIPASAEALIERALSQPLYSRIVAVSKDLS